jgi:excisionase family DNA binding protein
VGTIQINTEEGFLTVPELAQRWRVDKHWIYRNLDLLGIPHLRFGRAIRFSLKDIQDWEQQNSNYQQRSGSGVKR